MAIFSTVARPKLGAHSAMSSAASRPEPATMAVTRSRVGGMTGRPSVTPRSKSVSKGSRSGSVTGTRSGLADAKVGVVTLGDGLGIVGVRQDRYPRGLRRLGLLEELRVVLEDVDALFRPRAFLLRPAPDHQHLRQATARCEPRARRHHRAPDVLERLHRYRRVRE